MRNFDTSLLLFECHKVFRMERAIFPLFLLIRATPPLDKHLLSSLTGPLRHILKEQNKKIRNLFVFIKSVLGSYFAVLH